MGSVPFSVREKADRLLRKPLYPKAFIYLVPSLMVRWFSPGRRWLPSGDGMQIMPQPTFTENGTDPGRRGQVCPNECHAGAHGSPPLVLWPGPSGEDPPREMPEAGSGQSASQTRQAQGLYHFEAWALGHSSEPAGGSPSRHGEG
jgi:hypothetical protein